MELVHAPYHAEAAQELKFLQKPDGQQKVIAADSGPVTTKDIADTIAINTHRQLGEQMAAFLGKDLRNQRPAMAMGPSDVDPLKRFDPGARNPFADRLGRGALSRGLRAGMPQARFPGPATRKAQGPVSWRRGRN